MFTDFQIFFTNRFTSKYATKSSLTIPPHLKSRWTTLWNIRIGK